ncbi:hypothetical protein [Methylobacter psychrophilus]|uniref:hypothetical protein n=1 Tax=Methylobacter psychrophilus TaxID=96941 RepID=UPI0021D4CE9A|nr:hypothetical protein [Methylobacter psychrophilus]
MNLFNLNKINLLALEPNDIDGFECWVQQKEVASCLENEAQDEYIILYASLPHTFIHTVLIPIAEPEEEIINDLLKWSYNPFSSWSLVCSSDNAWIEPPLSGSRSKTLKSGEQIIFGRSFDGDPSQKNYYELNQKIAHVLDVHFVSERNSWCKLDDHGDIDDIFKIININTFPRNQEGTIICVKRDVLGGFASVENLRLMRMFDFTRYRSDNFSGWGNSREHSTFNNSNFIFGTLSIASGIGSYSTGFQLIDIKVPKEQVVNTAWGKSETEDEKEYCTYIASDLKNKVIAEISCNPSCLSNYFTVSELPFEVTPAFFKPEVLSKYKSDRAKYKLDSRSIECRGSWHLKTFDINSAGQVHTYLIYLSNLPYHEQLHWKQFNENPKAPLSDRAIKTDFEGQFYEEYDPLPSLKRKLDTLYSEDVNWWKLRDQEAPGKVHYPYTNSRDEWAEEILNLDQLLVEGLEEKWLRKKAKDLKCNPDERLRALKLIEIILVAANFEEFHAREIMSSLHIVHNLRSVLKGHTSGTKAEKIRKDALTEHGSFRKHFEKICTDCDESIEILASAFKEI